MDTDKRLNRGLYLKQQIRDLGYFLETVKPYYSNFDVNQVLMVKIKTERSFSIFGGRSFGLGRHEKEINIPSSVMEEVHLMCEEKLKEYKEEYKNL